MRIKLQQLQSRVVRDPNILNWSSIHKCILMLVFFIFIKMLWITWTVYTLTSPHLLQYINFASLMFHLKIDLLEFVLVIVILPVFYFSRTQIQAQRYLPYQAQRYLPYVCMVLLISMLVFDWYSSGPLAVGIIINVMSFFYLMIVLFKRKILFFSLCYSFLIFCAIDMSGIVTGEFNYAPMFNLASIGYPNFKNKFWLASTLYFSAPPFLIGIYVLSTILNQWRKREIFITELSQRDDLTGLYNRRVLTEHLVTLDQHDLNTMSNYAILLLDLDHFKRVNDTYGHIVGDQVLIQSAKILQQNLRSHDLLGRYGGEEFLMIIQNSHSYEVYRIAERCRQALENFRHQAGVGTQIQVTCSIGIAFSQSGKNWLSILNEADLALYEAKLKGRNRVIFA